ncbi:hypothetical protein CTE07_52370 [Chitinophaga terrae (ex Kim and Jung 2007)]|nr:hypothetical protein CTE07_52370 [Chitinophaga terrae (ex Kim and Jung 2007)]
MIAKQQQAHLTAIFPDDLTYHSFDLFQLLKSGTDQGTIRLLEENDEAKRKTAVGTFEAACQEAGIGYNIHHSSDLALQTVLEESIYADLLIIDARETFAHDKTNPPTRFIRDLLTDVQCPVLIVPGQVWVPPSFNSISHAVLLYDGSPSSVYAIKMYNYLLPSLQILPTTILSVNRYGNHLKNKRLMRDFIENHFPEALYKVIPGSPDEEIPKYMALQPKGTIAVLGAYRRSTASRWFKESMADIILEAVPFFIFVAHHK